jgi:ribosomal protein S6
MRSYKLVLLLKSDLNKEKKKAVLTQVEGWAKAQDAKVIELGEKKLAYSIRHEKKGDYVALEFKSEKIDTGFEKRLVITDDILRHLMIRVN